MITILKKIFFAFSRGERPVFWTALFLIAGSSLGLILIFITQKTAVVPTSGGDYTEGIAGQPAYINPILASTEADKILVRLLFANLSELADNVTPSQNAKTWDVRLKENIFWSDGEKLTSDDIIFTIQKIRDPETKSPLFSSWQGITPQRMSELEIQLKMANPYAFFSENLKNLHILPKHLFAETPAANWNLSRYNLQPVGSGPYAFASYENRPDGFITRYRLKANPRYFKAKPMITNFNLEFFSNAGELIQSFNTGQIDGFAGIGPDDISNIKRSYEEYPFTMPSYYAVFFNQNQNLALQSGKVREALDAAVDRNAILAVALGGKGNISRGPVSFLSSDIQPASGTASLESANRILDSDGWRINSSSSIRQKRIKNTAVDLKFTLTVPQVSFLVDTAKELQAEWRKIGVKADIDLVPLEQTANDIIKNRNYQAILFGNVLNPDSDLFAFWHSSQRFYPGLNLSLYNNAKADRLMTDIRQNPDASLRGKELSELQALIPNDHPAIFLYSPYYFYFTRKDLYGVSSGLIDEPADRFQNVSEWYLKTARVLK
ncbi:MAG: hypothetical protein HY433_01075 [Candidatus Liptonbacteria bacterium]|nr:hypothetical protein [Candidatus Liptonbacteria bacterium]